MTGALSSARGHIGHALGAGLSSMCTPTVELPRESSTVKDPAPDDEVSSDFCDFLDVLDEVVLLSVTIEHDFPEYDELPKNVDGKVGIHGA